MQKFQRRLFYAPVSSEDNVAIENFNDSVTNNHSNTNVKIVNLTLSESLLSSRRHEHHLRIIKHTKRHASSLIALSRLCTQKESEIGTSDHVQCK
jgi:hypothetical protein